MALSLQVLGSSGGYPVGGLACSGYLLSTQKARLLLDCGPGVATSLLARGRHCGLDGVVISHLHPDHVLDLIPLAYALLNEFVVDGRVEPLSLFMPEGGARFLANLSAFFGHAGWRMPREAASAGQRLIAAGLEEGRDWVMTVFNVREYRPGDTIRVGEVDVLTCPTNHNIATAAMRACGVVYTADTRFHEPLADFANSAELMLADAHMSGPLAGGAHMSPSEAARLADMAGVAQLVLCHLASPDDATSARAEAARIFDGPVHLACETREYVL